MVAMVGMRASCQPMPVLMMVAPAASMALASCTTSSQVLPPSTRSSIDRRKMMMKFGPTFARVAFTVSTAWEADAVLERAAPLVGALVGLRRDELVDQVALGAHDLDAVVAGLLRQPRAARVVADRLCGCPSWTARARREAVDRGATATVPRTGW